MVEEPKLLKTEEADFWKGGGESKKKGGVIGGRSGERGESCQREDEVHVIIGEHAVKPRQDRIGLLVRPGIEVIRKINLGDTELLDCIVEVIGESGVDRTVLVGRASDQVEVPEEGPRSAESRWQLEKVL